MTRARNRPSWCAGSHASPAFQVVASFQAPSQARAAIDAKQVAAVLRVPQRFSADVLAGRPAQAQLLLDARRSNTALLAQGYAADIVESYAEELHPGRTPLVLLTRDWFNPTLESTWFILPGLVAVLSLMMAMLVSALSLARERELGTFEQLLVTPLRPVEIAGRQGGAGHRRRADRRERSSSPPRCCGSACRSAATCCCWRRCCCSTCWPASASGWSISSFARTQQQAMLGVFVIASPLMMLSGFAAPVENMPRDGRVARPGRSGPLHAGDRARPVPAGHAASLVLQAWPMALIGWWRSLAWLAVRRVVS